MFRKILVANRGEIAIRAFRAAYELGAKTVAVFPYEDRNSLHRLKADEAYLIGEEGHPVKAYLTVSEIIRVAKLSGADAIYPGYGFLSENPELAEAAKKSGITFIGPSITALNMAGNKVLAKQQAIKAGVPVLKSTEPSNNIEELIQGAKEIGFPVFCKAVAGGGGRGMRLVDSADKLRESLEAAMREAQTAFGDSTMFIEQAVARPRHIEVQILADKEGNTVHLFERDCSVQRRHQKVIEIAPAPNISESLQQNLYKDAVAFAKSISYENAGTVEFLVETEGPREGQHVFIEMNPRIQVEHTVTEEVTDIDLVQAQIKIAYGKTLKDLSLDQSQISLKGYALQCRITTEDPEQDFRPDTGKITTYRSPGGGGVRLDGGTINPGAQISPHFDSMLTKLTCRGRSFSDAVKRAKRSLAEFRIRGVATNIPFLQAVLNDEDFVSGNISTGFIAERPYLTTLKPSQDRGTKIVNYLADVTVNQPYGHVSHSIFPSTKLPKVDLTSLNNSTKINNRAELLRLGPVEFSKNLRLQDALAVTDTTMRDAHQSLLATRVRTKDLLDVAPYINAMCPQLLSVEAWGGATYDVALRFLGEDPWQRLASLRDAMPNTLIQMLLRGRNTVGYTPYPEIVTKSFVAEAAKTGVDIFRIFDALNDVNQMLPAIDAVLETGTTIAQGAICYTGNILDKNEKLYTIDYYLTIAEKLVAAGVHSIAIKDMAGLLRQAAAKELVGALRSEFDLPVQLHTHDTSGGQMATLISAVEAGVDAVDVASAPLSGTTSQPSLSALIAATQNTSRDTGLSLDSILSLEPYWDAVRKVYAPFESGLPGPTGRVYHHEIPGGQLSNLRQQAIALGLADDFELIEDMYAAADRILGRVPKVTPSSKVVGDLALHLAAVKADPKDFALNPDKYDIPDSVISFMAGELGELPGGWPEPFRSKVLAGKKVDLSINNVTLEQEKILLSDDSISKRNLLNELLFPAPTKEYNDFKSLYGDLSNLDTFDYLYGLQTGEEHSVNIAPGVTLYLGLEAIGAPDDAGIRTVMTTLNGQIRPVFVKDKSIKINKQEAEKADLANSSHIACPFAGAVTLKVAVGDSVTAGDTVATIEAMKMEAAVTTPITGIVKRILFTGTQQLTGADLICVIEEKNL